MPGLQDTNPRQFRGCPSARPVAAMHFRGDALLAHCVGTGAALSPFRRSSAMAPPAAQDRRLRPSNWASRVPPVVAAARAPAPAAFRQSPPFGWQWLRRDPLREPLRRASRRFGCGRPTSRGSSRPDGGGRLGSRLQGWSLSAGNSDCSDRRSASAPYVGLSRWASKFPDDWQASGRSPQKCSRPCHRETSDSQC